jgi:hypothetical protein
LSWTAPITQYSSLPAGHFVAAPAITQYSSLPAHVVAAPAISYAHHVEAPAAVQIVHSAPLVKQVVAAPQTIIAAPNTIVPAPLAYASPLAVAHAPVVVAKAAASYTAVNRGAVHTAPLPGHDVSQTSLNLAPAPGTL